MSSLSPSQQPPVLFSIYQNNTWTLRRLVDEKIDPATQRIILKIVRFNVLVLGQNNKEDVFVPVQCDKVTSNSVGYLEWHSTGFTAQSAEGVQITMVILQFHCNFTVYICSV